MRALLLALVLFAPTAAALDTFPGEARLEPHEARFLVRVHGDSALSVKAEGAPVRVALASRGADPAAFVDAPASLALPSGASWHGLDGVAQLVVERDDAHASVLIEVADGDGPGAALEWPGAPAPVSWGALAVPALALAALVGRR